MSYYLFNFGHLDGAKHHFPKAGKIIDGILMFQGLLPEAAKIGANFPARYGVATFLMGRSMEIPESDEYVEDLPYFPAELFLWIGDIDNAEHRVQKTAALWAKQGWNDLLPRCELVKAEVIGHRGMFDDAINTVQQALAGVAKNGTASWFCSYLLVRGRIHRYAGNLEEAESALLEGVDLAERCGFGLFLIDLLIELSRICLLRGQTGEAIRMSEYALHGTAGLSRGYSRPLGLAMDDLNMVSCNRPECEYAWGGARAGEVLGEALLRERRNTEASATLGAALDLQKQIGDPRAEYTSRLLKECRT